MKDRYRVLLIDEIEEFKQLFVDIQEISSFNTRIESFSSLSSKPFQKFIQNKHPSDVVIAISEKFYKQSEEKVLDALKQIYSSALRNILFLCSTPFFYQEKEVFFGKKHVFLLSQDKSYKSLAINFNLYVMELFNELKTFLRLTDYIKELDEKNAAFVRELKAAKMVQLAIIPPIEVLSCGEKITLASSYTPLENVGGDLYDVIRVGKNGYGFLVADVSGHGIPAALITSLAKSSFNYHSGWGVNPATVCEKVNQEIYKITCNLGFFLTAYYGILNLETGTFEFSNAGHNPALHYCSSSNMIEKLNTKGPSIGVIESPKYKVDSVHLEKGDRIYFMTDGIIEAKNNDREIYSYKRMKDYILKTIDLSPKEQIDGIIKDIGEFCGEEPPEDDRTIFCFEFISKVESKF